MGGGSPSKSSRRCHTITRAAASRRWWCVAPLKRAGRRIGSRVPAWPRHCCRLESPWAPPRVTSIAAPSQLHHCRQESRLRRGNFLWITALPGLLDLLITRVMCACLLLLCCVCACLLCAYLLACCSVLCLGVGLLMAWCWCFVVIFV